MFFRLVTSVGQIKNINFVIDLTHRGVSVPQWYSIGVRNAKV